MKKSPIHLRHKGVARLHSADLETILSIDTPRWQQEMKHRQQHLEQFTGLPEQIWQAHHRVTAALDDAS